MPTALAPPPPFRLVAGQLEIDLPGGHALFTTRAGGVSNGPYASLNLGTNTGDDPAAVAENRRRLEQRVGLPLVSARQVHGTALTRDADPGDVPGDADGHVVTVHDRAAMVLVADCLPMVLAAPSGVAVLHGGWRGLADGIIAAGVRTLEGPVTAAIGPGAGRCCYETGEEVHERFARLGADVRDGRNLDLKLAARRLLAAEGVTDIHDAGICTMCEDGLFSHRRDGGVTGRQAGVAWRA